MNGQWTTEAIGDLSGRLAIVTGANTGIGFVTALELARHGADVVLACRDVHKAGKAVERIRAERPGARLRALPLDLAMLASVRTFAAGFLAEHGRLDLLINNAGVMMPPLGRTAEGFELQFGTNHLGHFALTGLLMNRLLATRGSRVVTVASLAHRAGRIAFDDLHWTRRRYAAWRAYGASKLANLLFTHALQRRLDANGATVTAVAAHPGWTQTELSRHSRWMDLFGPWMAMSADQGALPTLRAATDPAARGGDYFGPDGWFQVRGAPVAVQPRARARDDAAAERLWQVSEELTGVRFPI
jgi:NAD(P)-dependent dehydrogenase (short-subunit alcohol dehydrogenase family)